jgi:hypothetical protein
MARVSKYITVVDMQPLGDGHRVSEGAESPAPAVIPERQGAQHAQVCGVVGDNGANARPFTEQERTRREPPRAAETATLRTAAARHDAKSNDDSHRRLAICLKVNTQFAVPQARMRRPPRRQ